MWSPVRVRALLARLGPGDPDCRYCLGAVALLALAVVVGGVSLAAGDVVTALGSLLFLPPAALLAAIGLRGRGDGSAGGPPG